MHGAGMHFSIQLICVFLQFYMFQRMQIQPSASVMCSSRACEAHLTRSRYSLHSCVGETNILRSCHFRNLYFRIEDNQWVYFQSDDDPPRVKIQGIMSSSETFSVKERSAEDYYFLQNTFIDWGNIEFRSNVSFTPVVAFQSTPMSNLIYEVKGVSILWNFNMHSAYSYGHCLLNDWFPLFLTMSSHLINMPHTFNVISYNTQLLRQDLWPIHTCSHYMSAWSKSHVHSMIQMSEEARSQGYTWIRFCDLMTGSAGLANAADKLVYHSHSNPSSTSLFNSLNWRSFRNAVYHAFNLSTPKFEDLHLLADRAS